MSVFADLNFKSAAATTLGGVFVPWVFCTAMNAITVFVLVSAALLAWGWFA